MTDPYLEKLLIVQSEVEGIDMRINALERGYALNAEEVDAFIQQHRSTRIAKYEDFLSKEELQTIKENYIDALNRGVECDSWDYGLSAAIGVFCGIVDAVFCSTPHKGVISGSVDNLFGESVKQFAIITGWDPREGNEKNLASAIGYLEGIFKVGYDQAKTKNVNGAIKNMTLKNHHAFSAGHYLDIFGLFFSICDQFSGTATFYDKSIGSIKIVPATRYSSQWAKEFFENLPFDIKLQGDTFISKIIAGTLNWFGHCMSDICGSSGSKGVGAGLPVPFTEFFQFCNFGKFYYDEKHYETFATVMTKVYEKGYDARHATATSVPVILNDFLIRMLFVIKKHFAAHEGWENCVPSKKSMEVHRMLTVGIGSMCMVDLGHAGATACGNWVLFFSKLNIVAWARFGQMGVQELQMMKGTEIRNIETLQDEISEKWDELLDRSNDLLTE